MHRLIRLANTTAALFAVACGGEPRSPDEVPPDAGRRVAGSSLAVGTHSIDMTLLRRVGQLDGPPEFAFGRIFAIEPSPDGSFYACDASDNVLRQYTDSGQFVRQVGRRGSGPAEYQSCWNAAVGPDSSVAVSDPMNGRIVVFAASGDASRVVAADIGGGLGGYGAFLIDREGRFWRKGWLPAEGRPEFDVPVQMVILDRAGARVDSLHVPSAGASSGRGFALSTSDGDYMAQPLDSVYAIGVDGSIATASPSAYEVRLARPGSGPLVLRRDVARVRYGRAERAEWEAWRAYFTKQNPRFPPAPIPDQKPFLRGVRVDELGRVWVHVHVEAEKREVPARKAGDPRPLLTWRERNTYDLFDGATGGYIGRLALPPATELMASRGDRIWLREEGESGEQLIGIYDLRPGGR